MNNDNMNNNIMNINIMNINMNNNNMNSNNMSNFNLNNNNINNHMQNKMINQNQNNQNNLQYSFSRYTKATTTGLKNILDTSYLNAVLQLLGSIRNIASYFLNPKNIDYINKNIGFYPLSFVFYRLFTHLYPYPERQIREIYKPDTLLELLGRLNVVYKTQKRRNPNELITFILNTINDELNQINKKNNNKIIKPNKYDKNNVIQYAFNNIKYNCTLITNSLSWYELKEMQCSNCSNITYDMFPFNIFELDILFTYSYNKKPITIYDCLKLYEMQKSNTLFCEKCGNYFTILYKNKIFSTPNYFIISLDRKNLDKNLINIPFLIDYNIDINNFVENKNVPTKYQLTGIISFYQKENKYISFCMSPVDKNWYKYNDEEIEPTTIKKVLIEHNNFNLFIPCILVYKSIS